MKNKIFSICLTSAIVVMSASQGFAGERSGKPVVEPKNQPRVVNVKPTPPDISPNPKPLPPDPKPEFDLRSSRTPCSYDPCRWGC